MMIVAAAATAAAADNAKRAADLFAGLQALDFRGTVRQARAFHLVRLCGRPAADAAAQMGVKPPALCLLLKRFELACGREVPPIPGEADRPPDLIFMDPRILDRTHEHPGTPDDAERDEEAHADAG